MHVPTLVSHATALAALILMAQLTPAVAAPASDASREEKSKALRPENDTPALLKRACPEYTKYASVKHGPYSTGPLKLPFQRPAEACRTFASPAVEKVIADLTARIVDKDLARLFENAYPNTLDTTVRWHVNGTSPLPPRRGLFTRADESWQGPQSFIITGDIDAEWLRDSTNQLSGYQPLVRHDPALATLIHGAISTQAEFVLQAPYCNAFQPPPPSGDPPSDSAQRDTVHPAYDASVVFECKYELDSLANFLALGNEFSRQGGGTAYMTERWYAALETLLSTLDAQSRPTFTPQGKYARNAYTFQRMTDLGTETLNLGGIGNPLGAGTGLVRSAFRPSDDATIFGFLIPSNAMMAVQLKRTAAAVRKAQGPEEVVRRLETLGKRIEEGVWEHGVVEHKKWGKVFAFEVDGYGSAVFMDDANLPSLLSLPLLGFVEKDNEVYQNTRKMILSQEGNPYYLTGSAFNGIGGPHIGVQNAWPMSALIAARTADSDDEVIKALNMVRDSSRLGLIHESVNVNNINKYTRPWFAWANSVFAGTILDLAENRPEVLFGKGGKKYVVDDSFRDGGKGRDEDDD